MTVNEAPRLTTRVVALLMLVVFLMCLAADQLQCTKNGRQYYCSGRTPYHCTTSYCREKVTTSVSTSMSESCRFAGTAEVVLAVVEVGPSLVSSRGKRVSAYMAEELTNLTRQKGFPTPAETNEEAGECNPWSYPLCRAHLVKEYYKLSRTLNASQNRVPRNVTLHTVTTDAIDLPLHQHGRDFSYVSWSDAVEAVLPTSKVENSTQLAAYFPNLYNALDAAVQRRKASTANSRCDTTHVVVYIVASPLASVRALWQRPKAAREEISEGYSMISGAVTRYLTTNRRIMKYLNDVRYAFLYVPPPARQFRARYGALHMRSGTYNFTDTSVLTAAVTNSTAALAFCGAGGNTDWAKQCRQGCQSYPELSAVSAAVDGFIETSGWGGGGVISASMAASSVYANCYFNILSGGVPVPENVTFDPSVEAKFFDDCSHLSPAGGRALASCLLNASGYWRPEYDYQENSWY